MKLGSMYRGKDIWCLYRKVYIYLYTKVSALFAAAALVACRCLKAETVSMTTVVTPNC